MTEVKLLFADKDFYRLPPKKIKAEDNPGTGRTYFLAQGRIVAVAEPSQKDAS